MITHKTLVTELTAYESLVCKVAASMCRNSLATHSDPAQMRKWADAVAAQAVEVAAAVIRRLNGAERGEGR